MKAANRWQTDQQPSGTTAVGPAVHSRPPRRGNYNFPHPPAPVPFPSTSPDFIKKQQQQQIAAEAVVVTAAAVSVKCAARQDQVNLTAIMARSRSWSLTGQAPATCAKNKQGLYALHRAVLSRPPDELLVCQWQASPGHRPPDPDLTPRDGPPGRGPMSALVMVLSQPRSAR
ncbi:hypothetical protein RRG08_034239 [Elysia crispata]|uniref:Uncharacterized protein n=1 Tax=Elysia crispata TaxID=231223 RepID=A0AAE1DRG7_9GAST|nr:hypothetical protein RRG08_034239 [Elysia crispata]